MTSTELDALVARVGATIHRINNHWWNRRVRPTAPDIADLIAAIITLRKSEDELREALEGGAGAKFWFARGYASAWCDTIIIPRQKPPFGLSDAAIDTAFEAANENYDGDWIADLRQALSNTEGGV